MNDINLVKAKIQKLVALSFSSNEGEARNAMAAAQALADKHKLDLAAIEHASEVKDIFINASVNTGRRNWKAFLISYLVHAHGVVGVHSTGTSIVKLYGKDSDVETCGMLFVWICDSCNHFASKESFQEKTYLSSFRQGFVEKVIERLRQNRAQLDSTALAILTDTSKARKYVREECNIRTKPGKALKPVLHSALGYAAGKAAGSVAEISRNKPIR